MLLLLTRSRVTYIYCIYLYIVTLQRKSDQPEDGS